MWTWNTTFCRPCQTCVQDTSAYTIKQTGNKISLYSWLSFEHTQHFNSCLFPLTPGDLTKLSSQRMEEGNCVFHMSCSRVHVHTYTTTFSPSNNYAGRKWFPTNSIQVKEITVGIRKFSGKEFTTKTIHLHTKLQRSTITTKHISCF